MINDFKGHSQLDFVLTGPNCDHCGSRSHRIVDDTAFCSDCNARQHVDSVTKWLIYSLFCKMFNLESAS